MSHIQTSPEIAQHMTQHAMLVIWGLYARRMGLVEAIEAVKLRQKVRTHTPQTKVLEFLVAMLGGLAHLQDISRATHPLDQDFYTRGRFPKVTDALSAAVTDGTEWNRVGSNAHMTGWRNTIADDYFAYPLNVALLHPLPQG